MKYFKKIAGERLYLSPVNTEDVVIYTEWLNDEDVAKYLGQDRNVISLAGERDFLEKFAREGYNLAIVLNDGDELIGNISLMNPNFIDRTAEIGLFIGAADRRGKGYGPEAIELMIRYGFNVLNLQNICLNVYAFNARGLAAYRKIGFREYGRRTKAKYHMGQFHDVIKMEILKGE